tara:strand:- start:255 stop:437 length:183 start_codon:yes stop_codon:yes gene_type:complete
VIVLTKIIEIEIGVSNLKTEAGSRFKSGKIPAKQKRDKVNNTIWLNSKLIILRKLVYLYI